MNPRDPFNLRNNLIHGTQELSNARTHATHLTHETNTIL